MRIRIPGEKYFHHVSEAAIIWLVAGISFTALILYLDDTNYGTGNGLWKSVFLRQYMTDPSSVDYHHPDDLSFITNLLYFPVYSLLIQHTPLSGVDLTLVKKMAIINGWFGALSLAFFYILLLQITGKRTAALLATLLHLACGTFLSLSTNSDDFIPAYALFAGSLIFFYNYGKRFALRWLAIASVMYCLSWLFHWTIALPVIPALVWLIWKGGMTTRSKLLAWKHLAIFFSINLIIVCLFALWFDAPVHKILYSGKSMGSGIMGWRLEKLPLLYSGMMLYILGGFQFLGMEQLRESLASSWYLPSFIVSSLLFFSLFIAFIRIGILKAERMATRNFSLFLLWIFTAGQLMNAYESGTDLQFHLQPMIWFPVAYGLLANRLMGNRLKSAGFRSGALTILILIPAGMLAYNILHYRIPWHKGKDSYYVNQVKSVWNALPSGSKTYFVTRGWDEFGNWSYSLYGNRFRNNSLLLVEFLENYPEEPIDSTCQRLVDSIGYRMAKGYMVLTGPEVLTRNRKEIADIFEGFAQREKILALIATVDTAFYRDTFMVIPSGVVYRLRKKEFNH